jgi:putative FmdB family regulatory protein
MPIYAYRCAACGHAKDVLQKMSDAPLTTCPSCGEPRFEKQVTAAGFQLKGSGWYVTDFREGQKKKAKKAEPAADKAGGKPADKGAGTPTAVDAKSGTDAAAAPAPAAPASAAPAPPAAPPASGTSS